MKIAVLLDISNPERGGSYSFNKLIYDYLSTNRTNFIHEFIFIFANENNEEAMPDISLPSKLQLRIGFIKSFAIQITKKSFLRNGISFETCRSAFLNKLLKKNNIDAVWAIQPLTHPVERPFFTTSWDIAHKITPYFPELSQNSNELKKRNQVSSSVFSRAMRIIVGTQHGKKEIEVAYGINSERIIVNPFPCNNNSNLGSRKREQFKLIYPANFWTHKNHAILIEALKIVVERTDEKFELYLPGSDKGSKDSIVNLVKKYSLSNNVKFVNFISSSELISLYLESNLLIFPSLMGPDNLPPLEALSFGCKIAVADIPGAREQFGNFAFYFDPYKVSEIADIIQSSATSHQSAYNMRELDEFLSARSCENYVNLILKEFDKFDSLIKYI